MCIHAIAVFVTSFVLALGSFLPDLANAQIHSAQPAVQAVEPEPIGKVVTTTGAVTIEHAGAIVVQAKVAGQAGQTKVGYLVQPVEQRPYGFERVRVRPKREIQFDIVQPVEGNVHFRCRQDRKNR
jgi:hypothetical protein